MKKKKRGSPLFWILKHKEDNRVLCIDGKRRSKAAGIEEIKKYRRNGNAINKAGFDYVCYAVYAGDHLDCCGE